MFEDIVGAKFKGVDIGSRDIISEMKSMLMKGFELGINEMDMEDDKEFLAVWYEYTNENLDTIAQMYADEFSTEEIIKMLDFEMTPLAEKKVRFHIRMQKFVHESFTDMLMDKMEKDDSIFGGGDPIKNVFDALGGPYECDSKIWDSKEEGKE